MSEIRAETRQILRGDEATTREKVRRGSLLVSSIFVDEQPVEGNYYDRDCFVHVS